MHIRKRLIILVKKLNILILKRTVCLTFLTSQFIEPETPIWHDK